MEIKYCCPNCGYDLTYVKQGSAGEDTIECGNCGEVFTTGDLIEEDME